MKFVGMATTVPATGPARAPKNTSSTTAEETILGGGRHATDEAGFAALTVTSAGFSSERTRAPTLDGGQGESVVASGV